MPLGEISTLVLACWGIGFLVCRTLLCVRRIAFASASDKRHPVPSVLKQFVRTNRVKPEVRYVPDRAGAHEAGREGGLGQSTIGNVAIAFVTNK